MGLKAGRPTGRTAERVEHLKATLTQEEPEIRLNVRMPKSEYRQLKRFASESNTHCFNPKTCIGF
jgi:hypothetical protein